MTGLERQIRANAAVGRTLGVIMADIDHFNEITKIPMTMPPATWRCASSRGGYPPLSGKAIILAVMGARSSCFSSATQIGSR